MKREFEITPTPHELAEHLARLTGDEQAEFFNTLAIQDKTWKSSWPMQLQWVTDSELLNDDGRRIMRMIGEYGLKFSFPTDKAAL